MRPIHILKDPPRRRQAPILRDLTSLWCSLTSWFTLDRLLFLAAMATLMAAWLLEEPR